MRIIAGTWRSRRIDWPETGKTRPITDRVREALFGILGTYYDSPGGLPPLKVADVFAGGGSLGLEALSRGAERVCFFDRDPEAIKVLKRNLKSLGAGEEATIVVTDIWRNAVLPPELFGPLDLVFLDPPFPDTHDMSGSSRTASLLRRLAPERISAASALIVLRHERRVIVPETMGKQWVVHERRDYGTSAITLLVRANITAPPEETPIGDQHGA